MALISCPDCGTQVSDKATSCPKCACPLKETTLIEQTGKIWKAVQLAGGIFMALGILSVFFGCQSNSSNGTFFGMVLCSFGLTLFFMGRIMGWWYHG